MKKLVFLLSILLFTATSFAQNCMTFKGISFNNDLQTFMQQMKNKGMVLMNTDESDNYTYLTYHGNFAGHSACDICVLATKDKSCICKVSVYTTKYYDWYTLKSNYNELKDMFNTKYGNPYDDFHFFSQPYKEGDGYELSALKLDKCTYYTFWELSYGNIAIEIEKDATIRISYEDAKNFEKYKTQKQQLIKDDI